MSHDKKTFSSGPWTITSKPQVHRYNWYSHEQFKRWQFTPIKWLEPKIQELKDNKYNLSPSSSFSRTIPIEFAKLYISLDRVDTICTIFKLEKMDLKAIDEGEQIKKNINYGYLYSSIHDGNNFSIKALSQKRKSFKHVPKLVHKYICVGPSLESYDGEYRYRFNRPDIIMAAFEKKDLHDLWVDLHRYMKQKILNENLTIYTDYFYPRIAIEEKYNKSLETDIESQNYKDNLLVLSWFMELIHLYQNIQENHINKKFNDIMFSNVNADIEFMRKMILKYNENTIALFAHSVTHMAVTRISQTPVLGQKIIPLNLADVQSPLNINGGAWNEIYINEVINTLIVNIISQSFPIYADWFYIKNTSKTLFDNTKIYERMKYSETARWISKKLTEAQRQTYYIGYETDPDGTKRFATPSFEDLCHHINNNIDLTKSMSMSNVALCVIGEYVGRTIADVPYLMGKSPRYAKVFQNVFRMPYFSKYMFEIIYALYCMNSKCGIIHGDLHLNNATLTQIITHPKEQPDNIVKDHTYVLYVLDSKSIDISKHADSFTKNISHDVLYEGIMDHKNKYQFMFLHEFMYASIIDFSRGMIHPKFLVSDAFQNKDNDKKIVMQQKKIYIQSQMNTIISKYSKILNVDYNVKDKLNIGLINNFDSIWKVFTAYDIYMFTDKLMRLLKMESKKIIKIDSECISLLKKINNIAFYHLNELINIVDQKIPSSEIEYPNYSIIKECFSEYIVDQKMPSINREKMTIGDIYIYSNELKYSLDKFDNFPPYIKEWYGIKDLAHPEKKYRQKDPAHDEYIKRRKRLELRHKKNMETLWVTAKRQQEHNV